MFSRLLTRKSNFVPIRCYLPFDPYIYFLCIILDYKNLKYKYLIDDMVLDLWPSINFASMIDNIVIDRWLPVYYTNEKRMSYDTRRLFKECQCNLPNTKCTEAF